MDKNQPDFTESIAACFKNGQRLLDDAEWLNYEEHQTSSFALATIAQEEFAKAFLLFVVSRGVIPWNQLIYRATRDHTCKQLLILVMNYVNPYTDEWLERHTEWNVENEERKSLFDAYKSSSDPDERTRIWARIQEINAKHDSLPKSIADAICILRYEKIDRWRSSTWAWEEEPIYDEIAKSIGDGKLDREKQDALYVCLGVHCDFLFGVGHLRILRSHRRKHAAGMVTFALSLLQHSRGVDWHPT